MLGIRKTRFDDIDRVMEILSDARAAIARLGIDQWQDGYPDRAVIESDVRKGISHVIERNGSVEGTVVMMTDREPTYDEIFGGKWLTEGKSLVIHRIALSSKLRGTGASDFVIGEAVRLAHEKNCVSVKVDTHEGNAVMRRMLERNGFVFCGVIYLDPSREDKYKRVAYEKIGLNKIYRGKENVTEEN